MIHVQQFTFNPFMENSFVLFDDTNECVIIDPGCYDDFEQMELKQFVETNNLKVVKLLNTHCHIDHVLGNAFVKRTFDVELWIHKADIPTLKMNEVIAPGYGFQIYESTEPDQFLEEGDKVAFGDSELDVYFTPGHAPGHIVFYSAADKFCINGDVLFERSIGRTDLPGGNHDQLLESIRTKMYTMPDDTLIYTGHGNTTTIGDEKKMNPFCPA